MSFWAGNAAAPSFWQTLPFQTRVPGPLRVAAPPVPAPLRLADGSRTTIQRLFGTQSTLVSAFLSANYCGPDWRLGRCEPWIGNYLRDADVVALGLFTGTTLIATIFSVPMGEAALDYGSVSTRVPTLRMIEGLCVAAPYRSQGVAGYMIGMMDAITSASTPSSHLWCREIAGASLWDTALRVDIYGYRKCGTAAAAAPQTMAWDSFTHLWSAFAASRLGIGPSIIIKTPSNRKGRNTVFHRAGLIAVVADTGRVGGPATSTVAERIYEIVWSGRYEGGRLAPASVDLDFKQLLDGIAGALPAGGVLFATTSCDCGGVRPQWGGADWSVGYSGAHAIYIYNYMPPVFGTCRIIMVRDEI